MNDHDHLHPDEPKAPVPETPADAASQALSEALQSSFAIVKIAMVVLAVGFVASGFFKVDPQQQAVILRFGKPVGEATQNLLGPRPHWSYPLPIDEVVQVSLSTLSKIILSA